MLRQNAHKILAVAGAVAVIGAGVAVAADSSQTCTGDGPHGRNQATQVQKGDRAGGQQRLRKHDGTGPRHDQVMKDGGHNGQGYRGGRG